MAICCLGEVKAKLETVRKRLAARGDAKGANEVARLAARVKTVAQRIATLDQDRQAKMTGDERTKLFRQVESICHDRDLEIVKNFTPKHGIGNPSLAVNTSTSPNSPEGKKLLDLGLEFEKRGEAYVWFTSN